eukprot:TRINITY_DN4061_c0_g1_i1.p1 TRINITY_DN4061_c0_g1~~TRINITY_DN4061_c0_g1_i1.p1  ORF type:complete len:762 (+),score=111.87 TRINITY_DN4061_c0_g1_i1:80-2365(+)
MLRSIFVVVATLLSISHACITSIGGKPADPCACGLTTANGNRDCSSNESPPSSTTIWIPSANSPNLNLVQVNAATNQGAVTTGFLQLTVAGANFDLFTGAGQATFCLGGYNTALEQAMGCEAGCDTNFAAATTVPLTGNPTPNPSLFRSLSVPFQSNPDAPQTWNRRQLELEREPRRLCWNLGGPNANPATANIWVWTGLRVGVTWSCDASQTTQTCANYISGAATYPGITTYQRGVINARTVCCRRLVPTGLQPAEVGVCINPNTTACCGGTAVELTQERCCNATFEWTAYHEGACRCRATQVSPPAPANTGNSDDCPFDGSVKQQCCLPTKYPELSVSTTLAHAYGQCYNPVKHRCCNTGARYDPGTSQCCSINGVQSLNVPCPCGIDADCQGGQTSGQNPTALFAGSVFQCCAQTAPPPIEVAQCNAYANFPSGTGAAEVQRCTGTCFDTRYQICCNGAVCRRNFEKCCNSTCCNEFVGTCVQALRPGARGHSTNPLFWESATATHGIIFEQCSTIEQINPLNSFWIFILPAALLLGTLLTVAFALVFANKVNATPLTTLERVLLVGGLILALLATPLFFSPAYKYGIAVVFAALIIILNAATRVRWLNMLAVVVIFVVLLYLVDPFSGNAFGSFASGRHEPHGIPDYETSGVFSTIGRNWKTSALTAGQRYCTRFYDYFQLDPMLRDVDRVDNPYISTFGYCSRNWILALLFFAGFILILLLILFILTLLALILRFRKARFEPIELEVLNAEEAYEY